jgi:hypothetical protein
MGIVESAYYGAVGSNKLTDENLRENRRERVLKATLVFAQDGLPVIVDTAFHRQQDRLKFVERLRDNGSINEIIGLCCYAKDPDVRERRRQYRNTSTEPLEVEHQSAEDAKEMLAHYEFPSDKEPYPFVYFDTDRFEVSFLKWFEPRIEIKRFMDEIRDSLHRGIASGWFVEPALH